MEVPLTVRNGAPTPLRIFVVDGHADTRACYCAYLESLGHTVVAAASLTEALATLADARCDVLICELRLPDGDSWELPGRLDQSTPVYAVAATVLGTADDRERSRRAGFRHHLLKPFHTWELEAVLEEAARELAETKRDAG